MTLVKSYLIVLSIPFIINLFSYFESLKIINIEISNFREMILTHFQHVIDSDLSEIEMTAEKIIWDPEIKWLVNSANIFTDQNRSEAVSIKKKLKYLGDTIPLIDKIYIFGEEKNITGTDDNSFFFLPDDYTARKIEWEQLSKKKDNEYLVSGTSNQNIYYLREIPITGFGIKNAYVLIILDNEIIQSRLNSVKFLKNSIDLIYSENGEIILHSGNENPDFQLNRSLLENNVTDQKDGNFIYSVKKSKINGWKYVSILDRRILYRKLFYIRLVIVISIIICLILGFQIIYILSRKNYNPVDNILKLFGFNISDNKSKSTGFDEFSIIEKSVKKILVENLDLQKRFEQQNEILKKRFLARMLSGRKLYRDENIEEKYKIYNISSSFESYIVVIFRIEDIISTGKENELEEVIFQEIYYNFIGEYTSDKLNSDNSSAYITELDSYTALIIGFSKTEADEILKIINDISCSLIDILEQKLGILITIAASGIHKSLDLISTAYTEAQEAVEYEFYTGKGSIIFHENLPEIDNKYTGFSAVTDLHIKVINSIKSGNLSNAEKLLDDFTEKMMSEKYPVVFARTRMASVINTILEIINYVNYDNDLDNYDHSDAISDVLNCKSIPELQDNISVFFKSVEKWIGDKNPGNKTEKIASETRDFILKNFSDSNLSEKVIADNAGITKQYLSMIFKKHNKIGLLEFIHQTRIKEGKNLLINSTNSIKEISAKIGYYNDLAFIRAFKRYEATTPGKYREMNNEN